MQVRRGRSARRCRAAEEAGVAVAWRRDDSETGPEAPQIEVEVVRKKRGLSRRPENELMFRPPLR